MTFAVQNLFQMFLRSSLKGVRFFIAALCVFFPYFFVFYSLKIVYQFQLMNFIFLSINHAFFIFRIKNWLV